MPRLFAAILLACSLVSAALPPSAEAAQQGWPSSKPAPTAEPAAPAAPKPAAPATAPAPAPKPEAEPAKPPAATATASPARPTATAEPAAPKPAAPAPAPAPSVGSIHGIVFFDLDVDGEAGEEEEGMAEVEVWAQAVAGGRRYRGRTDEFGTFTFENLPPGVYRVSIRLPSGHVATSVDEAEVVVVARESAFIGFGASSDLLVAEAEAATEAMAAVPAGAAAAVETGEALVAEAAVDEEMDDAAVAVEMAEEAAEITAEEVDAAALAEAEEGEQLAALRSAGLLPLRFAPGRDTLAQAGRRLLGANVLWLGIPFISQMDGGSFQFVNCGPASLAMILAGFGLEIGPSEVREYLNWLVDNYNTDEGTSLDALASIARKAGLTPMDLYSDRGGYRQWSVEAVRWHVEQGNPVIVLTKYRLLPGRGGSRSDFDHYVVITGLTPGGFIFNDASFATSLGYGLEISDAELEAAWGDPSISIPWHALSLGLPEAGAVLSFPERPRLAPAPEVAAVPEVDESLERLLRLNADEELPVLAEGDMLAAVAGLSFEVVEVAPSESVQEEDQTLGDEVTPPGLLVEPSDGAVRDPASAVRRVAPQVALLLGGFWVVACAWSLASALARGLALGGRALRTVVAALATALR